MKKIFVIGGMGSGKSTAVQTLHDLGCSVVDLDVLGHEVLRNPQIKQQLCGAFGEGILDDSGTVNRAALAQRAFANAEATARLNAITRPAIEQAYKAHLAQLEAQGTCVCVVECSAFENRSDAITSTADIVVAVEAPESIRIGRAIQAGWDRADVQRRLKAQLNDEQRKQFADVVLSNEGSQEDFAETVAVWYKTLS